MNTTPLMNLHADRRPNGWMRDASESNAQIGSLGKHIHERPEHKKSKICPHETTVRAVAATRRRIARNATDAALPPIASSRRRKWHFSLESTQITHCSTTTHKFNSWAIFEAMFLKPIDVPEIRLKRTPFRLNLGNLHTSISH